MSNGMVTMAYIAASILFILSLSGLSRQDTSRRGNYFGMVGMAIASLPPCSAATSRLMRF